MPHTIQDAVYKFREQTRQKPLSFQGVYSSQVRKTINISVSSADTKCFRQTWSQVRGSGVQGLHLAS